MKNGYDHRYHAGRLRDTIVCLLKRLRSKISQEAVDGAKDNIYVKIDQDFKLYKVKRQNLKIYCTSKTEAPKGHYRRPEDQFLVDNFGFEIDLKTPYNDTI